MQKSPELRQKINEVSKNNQESWDRLEDYFWNTWFVLGSKEFMLSSWTPQEKIDLLELEYKKMVEIVLGLSTQEIINKLEKNKPSWTWTNPNIDSIKKAFLEDEEIYKDKNNPYIVIFKNTFLKLKSIYSRLFK